MASADFYGAIFNSFAISPKVSGSDDGQERAAIKLLRMIERFFIGINELSDDVVPRQREKFVHRAYAVGFCTPFNSIVMWAASPTQSCAVFVTFPA